MIAALVIVATAGMQASDAFAGIPGVSFDYYDVTGTDRESIRRSIDAQRVVDPHDGARVDALSNWHYGWSGRVAGCTVRDLTVDFTATVRLPRLAAAVAPDVQRLWDGYIRALERHEAGHVRYAYDHRGDLAVAIRGAGCGDRDAAAKAAIDRIDAWQLDYERRTRHGTAAIDLQ